MRRNELSEPSAEPVMIAKELPEATRGRHPRGRPPAPPLEDPSGDRFRIGPGLAAQHRGLACERLIGILLGEALGRAVPAI
jgi:hypothetical protein